MALALDRADVEQEAAALARTPYERELWERGMTADDASARWGFTPTYHRDLMAGRRTPNRKARYIISRGLGVPDSVLWPALPRPAIAQNGASLIINKSNERK